MSDRALRAAEKAVFYFDDGTLKFAADVEFTEDATRAGIAAYLDALLEDPPEEAVEAAEPYARNPAPGNPRRKRAQQELIVRDVLRSLRQGAG